MRHRSWPLTLGSRLAMMKNATLSEDPERQTSVISLFQPWAPSQWETVGHLPFEVRRTGDLSGSQSVTWSVIGTGAHPASVSDFISSSYPSGVVTFAPGESSQTIMIGIRNDSNNEADEGFVVKLSDPTAGATLGAASVTDVIRNDDTPTLYVEAEYPSLIEGDTGSLPYTFKLTRKGDLSGRDSVEWSVVGSGSNPASAADFVNGILPSGSVTFAPGESEHTVTLGIAGDSAFEQDETFIVEISNPSTGFAIAKANGVPGSIWDNDIPLEISVRSAEIREGQSGAVPYEITIHNSVNGVLSTEWMFLKSISVNWSISGSGSNPASAADFEAGVFPCGTLSFAPGRSYAGATIYIAPDRLLEQDETFTISLSSPSTGADLGPLSSYTATIRNTIGGVNWHGDDGYGGKTFVRQPGDNRFNGAIGHNIVDMGALGRHEVTSVPWWESAGMVGKAVTSREGFDLFWSIEEIRFADGRLVYDAADPAAQVVRLYQAALHRAPEQHGLNFWIDQISHGASLAKLANGFMESAEFAARYGAGLSTANYVEALYNNALGRGSDPAGKAHWINLIDSGSISRADALVGFSESAENQSQTSGLVEAGIWDVSENAAFVARLYDTALGRLPDVQGLASWRAQLDAGTLTTADMVNGFVASAEFADRYGTNVSTSQFVELLYNNALHRSSDPAGKANWVNVIDSGAMSRADAVLGFSESAEHVALTAPNIMSDDPSHYGIAFA